MIKCNKVPQFKRLDRVQGQGNACGKVQEVRMTYIEFFDKNASENICACLSCAPDRVILLGESTKVTHRVRGRQKWQLP